MDYVELDREIEESGSQAYTRLLNSYNIVDGMYHTFFTRHQLDPLNAVRRNQKLTRTLSTQEDLLTQLQDSDIDDERSEDLAEQLGKLEIDNSYEIRRSLLPKLTSYSQSLDMSSDSLEVAKRYLDESLFI